MRGMGTGMRYRRCGNSGVLLPEVSLGLWHNFGVASDKQTCRELIGRAMDLGICHFDLADNYGPPPGSAEETFGYLLKNEFMGHRDEMFISTKAGHLMWSGVYGDWGSRKHLIAGINQSLRRMNLEYVDVFYHHRPDPETPLEETLQALIDIVRSGKALYIGLSKYPADILKQACAILRAEKVPCLLHQVRYNLLNRECEAEVLPTTKQVGAGCVAFSPLAQGMLTGKYVCAQIPENSRAADKTSVFLNEEKIQADMARVVRLKQVADDAGLSLTELSLRYLLQQSEVSSVLIGARTCEQLEQCASVAGKAPLEDELMQVLRKLV